MHKLIVGVGTAVRAARGSSISPTPEIICCPAPASTISAGFAKSFAARIALFRSPDLFVTRFQ